MREGRLGNSMIFLIYFGRSFCFERVNLLQTEVLLKLQRNIQKGASIPRGWQQNIKQFEILRINIFSHLTLRVHYFLSYSITKIIQRQRFQTEALINQKQ